MRISTVTQIGEQQVLTSKIAEEDTPSKLDWNWVHNLAGICYWNFMHEPDNKDVKLLKAAVGNNDISRSFQKIINLAKEWNSFQ